MKIIGVIKVLFISIQRDENQEIVLIVHVTSFIDLSESEAGHNQSFQEFQVNIICVEQVFQFITEVGKIDY